MATVNLKFNQLLTGVKSRLEEEQEEPRRPGGLTIAKVPGDCLNIAPKVNRHFEEFTIPPKEPEPEAKVVFSLKDFMERNKRKAEEEEAEESRKKDEVKMDSDSDIEEVGSVQKNLVEDEDDSSDESVVNGAESMDEDTDDDLELFHSDKNNEVKKGKTENMDPDSDIDTEIEELHGIIEELNPKVEDPVASSVESMKSTLNSLREDLNGISAEFTKKKTEEKKEEGEIGSSKTNVKDETARLSKFLGLSIKKSPGEKVESSAVQDKLSGAKTFGNISVSSIAGLNVQAWKKELNVKRKAFDNPSENETKKPTMDKTSILIEDDTKMDTDQKKAEKSTSGDTTILIEDDTPKKAPSSTTSNVTLDENTKPEEPLDKTTKFEIYREKETRDNFDEDENSNSLTEEFDLCKHGDLLYDYMCYECTYNRSSYFAYYSYNS